MRVLEEENVAPEVTVLVRTVVTLESGGEAAHQRRNNYNSHYPANENLSHIKRFSQREIFSFLTFNYFPPVLCYSAILLFPTFLK